MSKYVGYFYSVNVLFLVEVEKSKCLFWKVFAARYRGSSLITIYLNRCIKIH
jgi:hypothetical protein